MEMYGVLKSCMEMCGVALGCEKLNEMRGAVWKCMEFDTVAVGVFFMSVG